MPIKSSGYYNDPALAQAASNLSALFEPPSGADAYGWAQAKKTKDETARLAEYYRLASQPGANLRDIEGQAIGAGLYTPNLSFNAVDLGDKTQRYGYDQSLAGTLGAADRSAAASRYGSDQSLVGTKYSADQIRAAAERGQDITADTTLSTALLAPVAKDATRFVPPDIAAARKVDEIQSGVIGAGANEEITVPGTDVVIKGPTTPLTTDQTEAAAIAQLPLEQQQDLARSKYELVDVINEEGQKEKMSRGEADRRGLAPVEKPLSMDEITAATFAEQLKATENDPEARKALIDRIMNRGETTAATKFEDGQAIVNGKPVPVTRAPGERAWKFGDGTTVPPDVQVTNLATPSTSAAEKAQTAQAIINGRKVPVTMKAGETVWRTADGQPIPSDAQVTNLETPAQPSAPTDVANGQAILRSGATVPVYQNTGEGVWRTQDGEPLDMSRVTSVTNLPTPTGKTEDIVPPTVAGDVQKKLIDIGATMKTAITLRQMIADAPAAAGLIGRLRGLTQDVLATGDELGQFYGGTIAEVQQDIKNGITDPEIAQYFDPKIPAVKTFGNILAYQYAKTMSEDRVSNESLKIARELLGVNGLLANQQSISAVLDSTLTGLGNQQTYLNRILKEGVGAATVDVPPPPAINDQVVRPPAAAGGTNAPAKVENWVPDGQGGYKQQ